MSTKVELKGRSNHQLQEVMEKLQQKGRGKPEQAREQSQDDTSARDKQAKQKKERVRIW